jgi:hypothetical protein
VIGVETRKSPHIILSLAIRRIRGGALAEREVRMPVPARLREVPALEQGLGDLFRFLPARAAAPGPGIFHAGEGVRPLREKTINILPREKILAAPDLRAVLTLLTSCYQLLRPRETWGMGLAGRLTTPTISNAFSGPSLGVHFNQSGCLKVTLVNASTPISSAQSTCLLTPNRV